MKKEIPKGITINTGLYHRIYDTMSNSREDNEVNVSGEEKVNAMRGYKAYVLSISSFIQYEYTNELSQRPEESQSLT